jgi:hypothetical protein
MTLTKVRKLQAGDEVYWNDPDEGLCSHSIKVIEADVVGNIVKLTGTDVKTGTECYVECYASELS